MENNEYCMIELVVKNHPGVMSHITGLFARRAFNLEGILCGRIGDGKNSRMYLLIKDDEYRDQVVKQLKKLYDVLEVNLHKKYNHRLFELLNTVY